MQMWREISKLHPLTDWTTVTHNMQIAFLVIHQALTIWTFDPGIPNAPFLRNRPVIYLRTAGVLREFKRDQLFKNSKSLSITQTAQRTANWKQFLEKFVQFLYFSQMLSRIISHQMSLSEKSPTQQPSAACLPCMVSQ
jgi:hypothetical protein